MQILMDKYNSDRCYNVHVTIHDPAKAIEFIDLVIARLKLGWTQGTFARHYTHSEVVRYYSSTYVIPSRVETLPVGTPLVCALGAMNDVATNDPVIPPQYGDYIDEYYDVRMLMDLLCPDNMMLADFNDNVAVDVTQVIDKFNEAKQVIQTELNEETSHEH